MFWLDRPFMKRILLTPKAFMVAQREVSHAAVSVHNPVLAQDGEVGPLDNLVWAYILLILGWCSIHGGGP